MKKLIIILTVIAMTIVLSVVGFGIVLFGVYLLHPEFKNELLSVLFWATIIVLSVVTVGTVIEETS